MFGLTDSQMLSNGIKIIDGIAGGGKSSKIDKFFRDHNLEYTRLTSTNRLSKDASIRYNMEVKTIAAGLFINHGRAFYAEEREAPSNIVVIDEILQADPRAIEWCINHADSTNIIITTDSKQLLSPENEDVMKEAFTQLRMRKDVIYTTVDETLRARDEKTRKLYHKFYGVADMPQLYTVEALIEVFPNVIRYEDMEYNVNDIYITHDNLTEDFLYKDKGFTSNPYLDLIPKGCIASNTPKDISKYPLLSQIEAKKTKTHSYVQVMNVCTPVRMQGSECTTDQKLYFLVQPNSKVSSRELYTVITRMWSIDSFVIVIVNTPHPVILKTFMNLPVKTHKYLTVHEDGNTEPKSPKEMEEIVSKYDTNDIYYDRGSVMSYKGHYKYVDETMKREQPLKNKSTAASIAKRDGKLNYTYMEKVYEILDKHNLEHAACVYSSVGRQRNEYEFDLYSAYPTILKYEKVPIDGFIMDDEPHENMMNFYIYHGEKLTEGSLITDDLKDLVLKNDWGDCEYIFSTPFSVGCLPGDMLHKMAHTNVETKTDIKNIHWGYYQRPYLRLADNGSCYVRYEESIYELLICHIFSQLLFYMLQIYYIIDGTGLVVDGIYFSWYDDTVVDKIKSVLPDYFDFRIRTKDRDKILYQSYCELKTRAEIKKEQSRERSARYRAKKKEI